MRKKEDEGDMRAMSLMESDLSKVTIRMFRKRFVSGNNEETFERAIAMMKEARGLLLGIFIDHCNR